MNFYEPQAYEHPVRLVIGASLGMPLLANLSAVICILLWKMLRDHWRMWKGIPEYIPDASQSFMRSVLNGIMHWLEP